MIDEKGVNILILQPAMLRRRRKLSNTHISQIKYLADIYLYYNTEYYTQSTIHIQVHNNNAAVISHARYDA